MIHRSHVRHRLYFEETHGPSDQQAGGRVQPFEFAPGVARQGTVRVVGHVDVVEEPPHVVRSDVPEQAQDQGAVERIVAVDVRGRVRRRGRGGVVADVERSVGPGDAHVHADPARDLRGGGSVDGGTAGGVRRRRRRRRRDQRGRRRRREKEGEGGDVTEEGAPLDRRGGPRFGPPGGRSRRATPPGDGDGVDAARRSVVRRRHFQT
jgi:hypothetical protein